MGIEAGFAEESDLVEGGPRETLEWEDFCEVGREVHFLFFLLKDWEDGSTFALLRDDPEAVWRKEQDSWAEGLG